MSLLSSSLTLTQLQTLFDKEFGTGAWLDWEAETLLLHFAKTSENQETTQSLDPILREKVIVLQILNHNLNEAISLPEFLLWASNVVNNQPADFEHISMPTSLELAWLIEEVRNLGDMINQPLEPSKELTTILGYLLREEGYSVPLPPFHFLPSYELAEGQTKQDTNLKNIALRTYIKHMSSAPNA